MTTVTAQQREATQRIFGSLFGLIRDDLVKVEELLKLQLRNADP